MNKFLKESLALLCLLTSPLSAFAQGHGFNVKLLEAQSLHEVETILKQDSWQKLPDIDKYRVLKKQCRKSCHAFVIEALLNSGLKLKSSDETEDINRFLIKIFKNKYLDTDEQISLAKLFIHAGAKISPEAVIEACHTKQLKAIAFCVENGADLNHGYPLFTPLLMFCTKWSRDLTERVNIEGEEASPAELALAEKKQLECARYLLEHGADANKGGPFPESPTPLNFACATGNSLDFIKLLVQYGADVNLIPREGFSPLQDACGGLNKNALPTVQFLVEQGANINQQSSDGLSPLMNACITRQTDLARYLIQQGANRHLWGIYCKLLTHEEIIAGREFHKPIALPTLAFCLLQEYADKESVFSWELFWLLIKGTLQNSIPWIFAR